MLKLNELASLGQSIWYDYIRRQFITRGELQSLIDKGLRGVTSNPSIFEKAIAGSSDYDDDIKSLINEELSSEQIYEKLAVKDIQLASDLLLPVYEKTNKKDGYISIEVSPKLAHNTKGTIREAKKLYAEIGKPNVMIKVPATQEGIPAIKELISSGISVNVTLIFSIENYKQVAEAYLVGLEKLYERGGDLKSAASVASFFISRIDAAVDKELDLLGNNELKGKIAIANAKKAFQFYSDLIKSKRWEDLEDKGAQPQRLLWASTSVKNPHYTDTLYIDNLIGKETVNTVPPSTFKDFMDHGCILHTIDKDVEEAITQLDELNKLGIDLDLITEKLQIEGLKSFTKSFENLMEAIDEKVDSIRKEKKRFQVFAGNHQNEIDKAMMELKEQRIVERIWEKDHTVWSEKPDEISNRLGWLKSPDVAEESIKDIYEFVEEVKGEGIKNALLLGMGGSSLAPEVFRLSFGVKEGYLDLTVLDSTHPQMIEEYAEKFNPEETLFIVSTKSGGTVETISFMKYFYNLTAEKVGKENASKHFIAITDPGSGLEKIAQELNFRKIFLNDPNIGGRYSALSLFGIVPAALIGVDLEELVNRAQVMVCNSEGANCPIHGDNTPANLGVAMGVLAQKGIDKLTFITSKELISFGNWVEQLIAESTGKNGKGILPVVGEDVLESSYYSNDRLFVYLKLENDSTYDNKINELISSGHPVIQIELKDIYELGGEFFRWEMAVVIAGRKISIQPFDQPNVESAKILARQLLDEYSKSGVLKETEVNYEVNDVKIYSNTNYDNLESVFKNQFGSDDVEFRNNGNQYIAIQAYVMPNEETERKLQNLRTELQKKFKSAVTAGYGPRFLHSTGQLHKGDAGKGVFIQLISESEQILAIPDEAGSDESIMSFNTLIKAQAFGDRNALIEADRKVVSLLFDESQIYDAVDFLQKNFEKN